MFYGKYDQSFKCFQFCCWHVLIFLIWVASNLLSDRRRKSPATKLNPLSFWMSVQDQCLPTARVMTHNIDHKTIQNETKWNARVLGHFFHCEGWIGSGTAWANEVKFLWNLSQSGIEPVPFYSESSTLPLDHGGPHTRPYKTACMNMSACRMALVNLLIIFHYYTEKIYRTTGLIVKIVSQTNGNIYQTRSDGLMRVLHAALNRRFDVKSTDFKNGKCYQQCEQLFS